LDDQLERLDGTAPEESDQTVAYELQEAYYQLTALDDELRGTDDLSLNELEEVEAYLGSVVETIDEHTDELKRQDYLTDSVDELESRRKTLETDIEALTDKKERLENELTTIKIQLRDVESKSQAFDKGRKIGRQNWQITYSCSHCNRPMTVEPGSDTHRAISSLLQQNGWGHRECVQ
jgi:chromosome segregation ATPase